VTGRDPRTLPLRVLVAAIALDGLAALAVADLLGVALAVVAGLACLAGAYASYAFTAPPAAALRKALSVATLVVVAGYAAYATLGQHSPTVDGVTQVGPLLAALLVGVQIAQSVVQAGRRELLVGLVVALFMTVLAAGLAPGPVVAGPVLLAWPAAVTALVLANRLGAADDVDAVATAHREGSDVPPAGRPAGRVAAVVAVCVLAGLAVFLVLPRPDGFSARSRLLGGESTGQGSGGGGEARSAGYYTQGYLDLRARGGLSHDPVMEVPVGSPQLWRTTVLDLYDGSGWQSSRTGGRSMGAGPDYSVPLGPDEVVPPDTQPRTDDVVLRSAWNGALAAPGAVTAVHAGTGQLVQVGSGLALFDSSDPMPTYTVTSVPQVEDPERLRSAGDGAQPLSRVWTQLPSTLPLRVRQLAAQLTAHTATRYDAVSAVERYLRTTETYRLDSPLPGPGADAVDDFLFVSHQGFCEQFASAAVVLLRARGIPARLATGFGYGQPASPGRRVLLASDAHAWVEVWYPGIGWSASDPTAGAALAPANQPSLLSRMVAAIEAFAASPGGRLVLAAALVLLALVVVGGLRLVRWVRRRRDREDRLRSAGPVLTAFWRLEAAMARAGTRAPPAETLAEFAYRLPAGDRAAVAVLERECYGPQPPPDPEATAAVATFDRLTAETEQTDRR
jgi:transglutaminase-like putative cysteine protease